MRIVVSGGSGFIGRAVVERLAGAGHRVLALVRAGAPDSRFPKAVEVLATGDLAGFSGWTHALEGTDALVHLAAIAHRSNRDDRRLNEVNVVAAERAARAAAAAKARFLYMSSVKVHGEETPSGPFRAQDAFVPHDAYARSKVAAERAIASIPGLDWTVLRPPLVYGPGVRANFLALMNAIMRGYPLPLASVCNRRSLLYVGNLAHALERCLEAPRTAGRAYLISDGTPVSTPELCRALGDALGRPARLLPFPPFVLDWIAPLRRLTHSLEVDDSPLRRDLEWEQPFTFGQALRDTADWYSARDR